MLIALARFTADIADHLRLRNEPLLAATFEIIEEQFGAGISLADIAATIWLTPGHLTTVVRQRSGSTVQEWIIERRMTQARKLLSETDLTVELIANRAGFETPATSSFKRHHGIKPRRWRHEHRHRT